jgi:hypothetical protein
VLLTRIPVSPAVCDPEAASNVARSSIDAHDEKSRADTKVEKVHLEWQQLCCTYNTAGGKIVVLHDVWGQAAPGEMQVRQSWHQQASKQAAVEQAASKHQQSSSKEEGPWQQSASQLMLKQQNAAVDASCHRRLQKSSTTSTIHLTAFVLRRLCWVPLVLGSQPSWTS